MKKKVICLVTNWYPTEENPIRGNFFREQALILKEHYNFLVVHYHFGYHILKGNQMISLCKEEENIKEYQINITMPIILGLIRYTQKTLFRNPSATQISFGRRLVKAFQKLIPDSFDVLYCVSSQLEAGYLKMLSDIYQKPYIVSEHAPFPWPGTFISDFHKKGIENANLLLAISNDKLRQIMMQNINIPSYFYVGNLVDESQFTYAASENKIKTFVMVGSHVFFKNHKMLIQIMSRLKNLTAVPFKLLLVGYAANEGYSKDTDVLERFVEESGLSQYIEMIPSVEHDNMPEIYHRADAFVMTSIQEGMPVSALEAGCCGLPIFSTRCGGVEDYVTEQLGRIYDILDVNAFAQGLCDFLEGRITFDSTNIRKSIVERFGKGAFIRNMVHAFDSIINSTNNELL